jgi:hypothetical protein
METALTARALMPDVRILLRLFDADLAERVEHTIGGFYLRSVADLAAPAFAAAMLDRRVLRTIAVARHVVLIADVPVEAESDLAGCLGAMLETCGSAGEGCTFPVSELRSQAMTGVGAPAGKVQPDAHRSPWRGPRPRGRQGRLAVAHR